MVLPDARAAIKMICDLYPERFPSFVGSWFFSLIAVFGGVR